VTIGVATQDYLKKILDGKFEAFTFSPVGVSILPISATLAQLGISSKELGVYFRIYMDFTTRPSKVT